MRKHYFGVVCLLFALCFLSACGGTHAGKENAQSFVKSIYTTNQDNRYHLFESSLDDSSANLDLTTEIYYQDLAKMADAALIDQMTANRIPMKYDMLYEEDPLTVDSVELTWDETAQRYDYVVSAHNQSGNLEFSGQIGCDDDGTINYFWEK